MKLGVRFTTDGPKFVASQARRPHVLTGALTTTIIGVGDTEEKAVADLASALVLAGVIKYQERKTTVRKSKTPKELPSA